METFGIEEEAMLVDSDTLEPRPVAETVLRILRRDAELRPFVTREYLRSQVEYCSPVLRSAQEAHAQLTRHRRALDDAASEVGVTRWHGAVPFVHGEPQASPTPRYTQIASEYRGLVREHQINAIHVHVGIPSREVGVQVMNAVRGWTPVLLALSANSPHWRGQDSGFDSWRTIQMRRWTTHDCPPVFADADDYQRRIERLVGVGGTIDAGTVAWNLRLSANHPTIEFRVFDAQLEARETVLLALICRALVTATVAGDAGGALADLPPELLEASLWQAARDGIDARLLDPVTGELSGARAVADALLAHLGPAADALGDGDEIRSGIDRLFRHGTGAARQRQRHLEGGPHALRDLHEAC
ncbi:carboxylate-amine ligase [Pseudoclavibacter terrae]|uniref:carboxylate-amine ligase n=1 Tax=Pseudoclavibacter terrae TaxID=1530195 RepID=UPI00232B02B7|nr:YbdK family carboxylate-amine ligase [Pseudoclavibacter terrae]